MQIMPLTGGLGAEILNADLKDSAQFDAVYQAFVQHSVVVIRDQDISVSYTHLTLPTKRIVLV